MKDEDLLALSLQALEESWATKTIPGRVLEPGYDRRFARKICRLMFAKCELDLEKYKRALNDFILLSEEFVRLQMELDDSGHYLYSSFDEVRAAVYDNPQIMEGRYLNGLFLSEAFWVNHAAMFAYFVRAFCESNPPTGTVLEIPCGTGLFISEFARRNPRWSASGVDLSMSAVKFAQEMARLNAGRGVKIARGDIFELPQRERYDRLICGELLEHLENPEELLAKLSDLLKPGGRMFLTTAIWAASIDHIYLFSSAREVREMLRTRFVIHSEVVLNVRDGFGPEEDKTPINYACVLTLEPAEAAFR